MLINNPIVHLISHGSLFIALCFSFCYAESEELGSYPEITHIMERILDRRYQDKLPHMDEQHRKSKTPIKKPSITKQQPSAPSRYKPETRTHIPPKVRPQTHHSPGWFFKSVIITGIIIIMALFIFWLYEEFVEARIKGWSKPNKSRSMQSPGREDITEKKELVPSHDLAQQGHFAEAMHQLLLISIHHLKRKSRVPLPDSLTSREILQNGHFPQKTFQAFQHMVGIVERVHFGFVQAQMQDYQSCVKYYKVLAEQNRNYDL